jgi:hypothetical protein
LMTMPFREALEVTGLVSVQGPLSRRCGG